MILVKISQNFIKSHLKFALSHRFQSTAYGMYAHFYSLNSVVNLKSVQGHLNLIASFPRPNNVSGGLVIGSLDILQIRHIFTDLIVW